MLGDQLARVAQETGAAFNSEHTPSPWLRSTLLEFAKQALAGRLPSCGHVLAGQPAGLTLWGRVIRCEVCLLLDELSVSGDDNYRCDRCSTIDRGTKPFMVVVGPVVVTGGLCVPCMRAERAA